MAIDSSVLAEAKTLKDTSISKMMRDDMFLPIGLDLLNFDIRFTEQVPKGAPGATYKDMIWINPNSEFFAAAKSVGMSRENVMNFLLIHENLHPLLYHDKRAGAKDHDIWNMACDFVINLLIQHIEEEAGQKSNGEPLVPIRIKNLPAGTICLTEKFDNMIEEEVYEYLIKNTKTTKKKYKMKMQSGGSGNQNGQGGGDGQDGDEGEIEVTVTETTTTVDGQKYTHVKAEFPPGTQIKPAKEGEEGDDKGSAEDRITLSKQMLQNTLMRGVESQALKRFLGKLFGVKVDWEQITKDSIMTALEKSIELAWGKPKMMWLANPQMPYMPNTTEEERFGDVVFAIDESGSMSDHDVLRAVEIIRQAKQYYKGVYVIKHDHESAWDRYYADVEDIDTDELCNRQHCGGTSHKHVFEKTMQFMKTTEDRMISCFIGVTDLCSDIPQCQEIMDRSIPRVWIVNGGYQVEGIWGKVIRVD